MRNLGNTLVLTIFIFLIPAALPAQNGTKKAPSTDDRLKSIEKYLKDSQEVLKKNFDGISKDLKAFQKDMAKLSADNTELQLKFNKALARIEALEKVVNKIEGLPHIVKKPGVKDKPDPPNKKDDGNGKNGGDLGARLAKALARIGTLEKQLAEMQKDIDGIKNSRTSFYPKTEGDIETLKKKIKDLETKYSDIDNNVKRVAKSSPQSGRLMLVNARSELVLFVVNGKNYRVGPHNFRVVEGMPPGALTYEVISSTGAGSSGQRVTGIRAGETLRLTTD